MRGKKITLPATTRLLIFSLVIFSGFTLDGSKAEMTILDAEVRIEDTLGSPPDEGYEFLYVQVEIENLEEVDDLSLNPGSFELVTDEDAIYNLHDYEGRPAKLAAGGTATFWISFEIPEDETGDTLRYKPGWLVDELYTEDVPSY